METKNINIKKHEGAYQINNDIEKLIDTKYSELFYSVIIHGSVATNEIIPYSDYDGLIIVKDKFINSEKLINFKKESMKLILHFDPLQHHGWFQISESQLSNYPQDYLPYEILYYSKLIYPNKDDFKLSINIDYKKVNYKENLIHLIKNIEKQSSHNFKSMRLYEFKSFLSKVMLIPAMYYSSKMNKGIFKKESFLLSKKYFTDKEWMCIERASYLREIWRYELNPIQKLIMTRPEKIFRRLTKKYMSPKINSEMMTMIDREFFGSLNAILNKIKNEIY